MRKKEEGKEGERQGGREREEGRKGISVMCSLID